MKKTLKLIPLAVAALLFGAPVVAEDHSDHDMGHDMGHGDMAMNTSEASAGGVINAINPEAKSVNITHEPIPALNWPQMTMDLPATNRVELSKFKAGDHVHFSLKLGMDSVYRITAMEVAKDQGMHEQGHEHGEH